MKDYRVALANMAKVLEVIPTAEERLAARALGQPLPVKKRQNPATTVRLDTLETLPNFHTGLHNSKNAMNFGTNLAVNSPIGELIHGLWKQLVPHSNYHELDLVRHPHCLFFC